MGNVTPLKPAGNTRRRHSPYVGFPLRNDAIEGSLLNQVPDGIYLVDEEIVFLCEEDNTENLLIEETEV